MSDLRQRWGAFDDAELRAIRNSADLVMQIQARYGLDKDQARVRRIQGEAIREDLEQAGIVGAGVLEKNSY